MHVSELTNTTQIRQQIRQAKLLLVPAVSFGFKRAAKDSCAIRQAENLNRIGVGGFSYTQLLSEFPHELRGDQRDPVRFRGGRK